jgi:hypothetical protein
MAEAEELAFKTFSSPLIDLPITHVWRGYGSAIFLEFGDLRTRMLPNGRALRNPSGEMGLMIEWSWRIEGKRLIWCGSWSDEDRWPKAFARLLNARVSEISLLGRLPEVDLQLSNGLHVVSMMTAEGDPQWALSDRRGGRTRWVRVKSGILRFGEDQGAFNQPVI